MAEDQTTDAAPLPYTNEEVEQARAAHEAKSADDLAYEAGRAAEQTQLARQHGVDACPFSEGSERQAWLRGFADALDEVPNINELRSAVQEAHDNA